MTENKIIAATLCIIIRLIAPLLAGLLLATGARADFVNLTGAETSANIAEIDIGHQKLRIRLEISTADADKFWPGIDHSGDIQTLAAAAKEQRATALRVISGNVDIAPSGYRISVAERKPRSSPFAGQIDPRTGLRLPDLPTDKTILLAELEYAIPSLRRLELRPPMNADGLTIATIGFIARHGQTPVSGFNYLSQAETLEIDWQDPWNTRFENPNISRHNRYPLMSFLYIEPRQVRHEILLRPRDLLRWTGQPFDAWRPLTKSMREQLQNAALKYLDKKNPAAIDEQPAKPAHVEVLFLKATNSGFSVVAENEQIELGSVLIGYRQQYPVAKIPQNVNVDWELFSDMSEKVPTLIQDPAGPFPTHVMHDLPAIRWQNFLNDYREPASGPVIIRSRGVNIPTIALLLFGCAALMIPLFTLLRPRITPVTPVTSCTAAALCVLFGHYALPNQIHVPLPRTVDQAEVAFATEALLTRLADAFEESESPTLERQLAFLIADTDFSATAANLTQLYRQPTSGGGNGKVKSVSDLKIEHIDRFTTDGHSGFRVISSWRSLVEGQHWGHIDRRQLEQRANIEIIQLQDQWKIAAFTPLTVR